MIKQNETIPILLSITHPTYQASSAAFTGNSHPELCSLFLPV